MQCRSAIRAALTEPTEKEPSMTADPSAAYATAMSAAELVACDDPRGELLLLSASELPHAQLRDAALKVFAGYLAGDPLESLRADIHHTAQEIGAGDRQVILNMEVVALLEATIRRDEDMLRTIIDGSEFTPLDHAHVAVSLAGRAILDWVGSDRAPGVFGALRRQHGISGAP